ncbi:MAG: 16S rRNA (cytosine(967)-C(5))-methyltransferase RsmB [Oscillospiraceae bacterium]|nr:16S rRNA (cytosine(967)-C(5))-methyltransferase RsmB [Oscillospiraceae bacterium]
MTVSPARKAALRLLEIYRRQGSGFGNPSDKEIKRLNLDIRDAALAKRLYSGVLQNTTVCDYYIDLYSEVKPSAIEPTVRDILRLSAYQILFTDKIPFSAAVFEGVELCKQSGRERACGFVNAVLRRISGENLPEIPGEGTGEYLSIKYSHPLSHVNDFIDRLGYAATEKLLAVHNEPAAVFAQINTLRTSADILLAEMKEKTRPHPWIFDCVEVYGTGDISELPAYNEGKLYIQDPASKLAVYAAAPEPGMSVLDACAAPGGKSFAAAVMMKNRGSITACDKNTEKLKNIERGASLMGFTIIKTRIADARSPSEIGEYDIVIADAPCSGFGTIGKKPEIRYKTYKEIDGLPEIQYQILCGLASHVAEGGVLLYSVCSFRTEENESVIKRFLTERPDFAPEGFALPGPCGYAERGMITLWPHIHGTDGFFICKLRKSR